MQLRQAEAGSRSQQSSDAPASLAAGHCLTGSESDDPREQEAGRARKTGPEAVPDVSWDFRKVPAFRPDRARRETPFPPIQQKPLIGQAKDARIHEADRAAGPVRSYTDIAFGMSFPKGAGSYGTWGAGRQ